jgi:hypothetical protein
MYSLELRKDAAAMLDEACALAALMGVQLQNSGYIGEAFELETAYLQFAGMVHKSARCDGGEGEPL